MADSHDDGELILRVGDVDLKGWKRIRVTRSMERMPADFDIEMSDIAPSDVLAVSARPGDKCTVMIGNDLVITGFVNSWAPTIDKASHSIRVAGRSLSQDLVDCSAEIDQGQFRNLTVLQIAQALAAKYPSPNGLTVSCPVPNLKPILFFILNYGDTSFSIIERMCRISALVAYDETNGNVILNQESTTKAAGVLREGDNVERAAYNWSDHNTFSDYKTYALSTASLRVYGGVNDLVAEEKDQNVARHRELILVAEGGDTGTWEVSKLRCKWEAARRQGRAHQLQVRVDSWRDSSGKLWDINTLVTVDLPSWKISNKTFVLGQVVFIRDDSGTHADLVLMLPGSYVPQPVVYFPIPLIYVPRPGGPAPPGSRDPPGLPPPGSKP